MRPYLRAKARADERLQESGLDYTIIRPGSLTEDEGTGAIEAAEKLGRRGEIPREDVASTFAAALEDENTYHKTFEILAGETPIREALARPDLARYGLRASLVSTALSRLVSTLRLTPSLVGNASP